MLAQRKDASGQPLPLSSEMSKQGHHLSFKRERGISGAPIGRRVHGEKKRRRSVINYLPKVSGSAVSAIPASSSLSGAAAAAQ
jgi:hypothetical protein